MLVTSTEKLNEAKRKKKILVFHKRLDVANVQMQNIKQEVFHNEVLPGALEQLSLLLDNVYLPLLEDPRSNSSWPGVVRSDVLSHYHRFLSSVRVALAEARGETLLPLPPLEPLDISSSSGSNQEPDTKHSLEAVVMDWTNQVA